MITLFDRKIQKLYIFGIFDEFLSTQNVTVSRSALLLNETFSVIFKHCAQCRPTLSKLASHLSGQQIEKMLFSSFESND